MRVLLLLALLGRLLWPSEPLHVSAVERPGLPPYETNEKVYRLAGNGCATLRVGEILVLQRPGERRSLGRLQITSVLLDHALARLLSAGETFPLKGDLAVRAELAQSLPELPKAEPGTPGSPVEALRPLVPRLVLQRSVGQGPLHREPIYFLKGDASLSPGALQKLTAWVRSWGLEGQWSLACPQEAGDASTLLQERISVLRAELLKLGVAQLEVRPLPPDPPGRYDAVYVVKEPW